MRKVIVSMNVTLDGFMAGPAGELDWHFPFWNHEMAMYVQQQLSSIDTILLGRVTYQAMRNYWSSRPNDGFSDIMLGFSKIVFSRTLKTTSCKNTKLIKGNIRNEMTKLKQQPGKDMIVYGSGSIVSAFIEFGLVDEFRIWLHPVVIGSGQPLFKEVKSKLNMHLVSATPFNTGVIILVYRNTSSLADKLLT